MKTLLAAIIAGVIVAMVFACDVTETVYLEGEPVVDTVYVHQQAWVGIEFTWADSGPLNSDVEDKRRAGWECGESLLDLPYWLPMDDDFDHWALTIAHFYICYAPVPGLNAEPFKVPTTLRELTG